MGNEIILKKEEITTTAVITKKTVIINQNKCSFRKLHITTKKLKSFILSRGFIEISRTGSHIKYRNLNRNKTCTFANKKDTYSYKIGTLKKILKDYNETLDSLEIFINT